MNQQFLRVLSSRERGQAMGKGAAEEEAILLPLVDRVRSDGTDVERYLLLFETFHMYCHHRHVDRALQILQEMDTIAVQSGDDCSRLIADDLLQLPAPTDVVERYIERALRATQDDPGPSLGVRKELFTVRAIELALLAKAAPDAPRVSQVVEFLCELRHGHRTFDNNLLAAFRVLVPMGVIPAAALPLLEAMRVGMQRLMRQYDYCGGDYASRLAETDRLIGILRERRRAERAATRPRGPNPTAPQ
jgi:hypothetical protein